MALVDRRLELDQGRVVIDEFGEGLDEFLPAPLLECSAHIYIHRERERMTNLMNLPRRQLIQLPLRQRMRTQTRPWPSSPTLLRPILGQPAALIRVPVVQLRAEDVPAQRTQDHAGEEPPPQVVRQASRAVAQVGSIVEGCSAEDGQEAAADETAGQKRCEDQGQISVVVALAVLLQQGRGPFLPVARGRDLV